MYFARDYSYICGDKTNKDISVYYPANYDFKKKLSALIVFFGGGWRVGEPKDEEAQAMYFSNLNMIVITPDYRTYSKYKNLPTECVKDAKLAVKWVYDNADVLGVDKDNIALCGGSAGGHLAICSSLLPPIDEDDIDVSSIPKAQILHNPALDLSPSGFYPERFHPHDLTSISPIHKLRAGLPPTVIFHGTEDKAVSYHTSKEFCERSQKLGNSCVLHSYPNKAHGFSAFAIDIASFADVMHKTEQFLREHGFITCE